MTGTYSYSYTYTYIYTYIYGLSDLPGGGGLSELKYQNIKISKYHILNIIYIYIYVCMFV